jgi:NAD+ diphosphatase
MASRFIRAYPPAPPLLPGILTGDSDAVAAAEDDQVESEAIWLPFLNGELLTRSASEGGGIALMRGSAAHLRCVSVGGDTCLKGRGDAPGEELSLPLTRPQPLYLGTLDGVPVLTCEVGSEAAHGPVIPPSVRSVGLRSLYGQVSDEEYGLAGYAAQLLHWERISGFCSVCGNRTEGMEGVWARRCVACGHSAYPPVSPAVLILVHDGAEHILLAHKPGWGKRFSILAGFVEPGESLEECVAREALEEAGVEVTDLAYFGSQPWPYPHQVMIGFTARCPAPDTPLRLDETELDDARWFRAEDLPELPPPLSLSRRMIDAWTYGRGQVTGDRG